MPLTEVTSTGNSAPLQWPLQQVPFTEETGSMAALRLRIGSYLSPGGWRRPASVWSALIGMLEIHWSRFSQAKSLVVPLPELVNDPAPAPSAGHWMVCGKGPWCAAKVLYSQRQPYNLVSLT